MTKTYAIEAAEFLKNVATFDASPAGEALIESDPAKALQIIIDQAKAIMAKHTVTPTNKPPGEAWDDWPVWS